MKFADSKTCRVAFKGTLRLPKNGVELELPLLFLLRGQGLVSTSGQKVASFGRVSKPLIGDDRLASSDGVKEFGRLVKIAVSDT